MKCRKIVSVLSALTLLTGSLGGIPVSAAAKGAGDVDCNGKIEIADAILLARWLAEDKEITVTTAGLDDADLNGDGQVTADDQAKLLCWLAGIEEKDPQPSEGRSVDLLAGVTAGNAETLDPTEAAFRSAQAKFTVDLLKQLQKDEEDKDKNLLISPVSVSLALGMTVNGAKGQTLAEMQKVLGDDLTAAQLNGYYAGWSDKLLSKQEVSYYGDDENGNYGRQTADSAPITLANAVWIKDDERQIHVPDQFLQTVADYYQAGAYKAPFDDTTVSDINNWCDEHTHHMITEVIKELPPLAVMVLANALTFEDVWDDPYMEYEVHAGTFHAANGADREAEMMSGSEHAYISDGKATGFLKSYRDPRYCFAAVLPNEDVSLDDYIAGLDGDALNALLDSQQNCEVTTIMPKFSFDYSVEMKKALSELGMPTAFTEMEADFTGLNDADGIYTWIGEVIHKTHIEVSETGTKAAAVTAVMMMGGGASFEEPKVVILDRPFLFMILDRQTNLPIFIGTVKDTQPE